MWTKPLVVVGRHPTAIERDIAMVRDRSRWLVQCGEISCIAVWAKGNYWSAGMSVYADGAPAHNENWLAINPDGSPVMVPCSREEALTAAGYRSPKFPDDRISDAVRAWVDGGGKWQECYDFRGVWYCAILDHGSWGEMSNGSWIRPVDALGNYDARGWGDGI